MIRPDYRYFRRRSQSFRHSSEGSSWKKHKYIKRVDGTYYYPDSYKGGRHLPDGGKEKTMEDELFEKLKNSSDKDIGQMIRGSFDKVLLEQMGGDWTKLPKEEVDRMQRSLIDRLEKKTESNAKLGLSKNDAEKLAKEVIRGNFGNGQVRKDLLGENYAEVQEWVNDMMKGSAGLKTIPSDKTKAISVAEEAAKRADTLVDTYRNKKTK